VEGRPRRADGVTARSKTLRFTAHGIIVAFCADLWLQWYYKEIFAMATDTTVRARIDGRVKKQAAHVLEDMGLSVSDAIRMMLMRVAAEKALPFEAKVPNAVTARTLRKADRGEDLVRSKNAADLFGKLGI
jgi:DNA-damage-inducible protein J